MTKERMERKIARKVESHTKRYEAMSEEERNKYGKAIVDKHIKERSAISDLEKALKKLAEKGETSAFAGLKNHVLSKKLVALRAREHETNEIIKAVAAIKHRDIMASKGKTTGYEMEMY